MRAIAVRIISIIAVFFALCCGVLLFMYNLSQKENKSLQANLNTLRGNNAYLQQEIKKRNENALALATTVKELEEAAKEDKTFDWHSPYIANSLVIKRLQAN